MSERGLSTKLLPAGSRRAGCSRWQSEQLRPPRRHLLNDSCPMRPRKRDPKRHGTRSVAGSTPDTRVPIGRRVRMTRAQEIRAQVPPMQQLAASIMLLRRPSGESDSSVLDNSGENGCCVLVAGAASLPVVQDFVLKNWSLRGWGSTAPQAEFSAGGCGRAARLQAATTTGRGSRWMPAIMQRTDPPASSMVGMSRGNSVHDCSMIASWSGRRLLAARRERARMRPPRS